MDADGYRRWLEELARFVEPEAEAGRFLATGIAALERWQSRSETAGAEPGADVPVALGGRGPDGVLLAQGDDLYLEFAPAFSDLAERAGDFLGISEPASLLTLLEELGARVETDVSDGGVLGATESYTVWCDDPDALAGALEARISSATRNS